ncbi:ROK family protein [Patescibacteria group bacterium]|nr:ROK family protein [Patescibacteria group bacterium]
MPLKNPGKVLAIDIGATNIRFATVCDGNASDVTKYQTPATEIALMEMLIERIDSRIKDSEIVGIGISAAGPVENNKIFLTNITKSKVDIVSPIKEEFGLPVSIINDADAAVLAEHKYGYGKDKNNLIYVTLSSGVGGGIVINNELVVAKNLAEEMGHQVITGEYDLPCSCGGTGHWEALVSGLRIANFMKVWSEKNNIKFDDFKYGDVYKIYQQAGLGDSLALEFLEEVSRISASAIDLFTEKYSPQVFVLGGSIALNNQKIVLSGIKKHQKSKVPIFVTNLGDEISLIGAAVYFWSRNSA